MDNYFKGKNVEEELEQNKIPITDLPENFLWMQVKGGSKMSVLLAHACGIFEQKAVTSVVWTGEGVAIPKAISCAEILKRQFSIPHQVNKLTFKRVEEFWEPKVDGLETIVVKRQIPVIHILLSVDSNVNTQQNGYQDFQGKKFWHKGESNSKNQPLYKSKKTFPYKKSSEKSL